MKIASIVALFGGLIFATPADAQTTALRGARVIDGRGGAPIDNVPPTSSAKPIDVAKHLRTFGPQLAE